eukprot:jgi/Botrbrau1/1009/Bobra.114_1s0047.1
MQELVEPSGTPGIAVIIGWMGSAERHMNKYADLWQSLGWETMVVRYNKWKVLMATVGDNLVAEDHRKLEEQHAAHLQRGGKGRVVFHCFSNTGWLSMGTFLSHFAHEGHPMRGYLCGAVIDSAPQQKVCHKTYAAGYIAAVKPRQPLREDGPTMKVVTTVMKVWVQGTRKRVLKGIARNILERSQFPQLYIYSSNDPIIPPHAVEEAIQMHRRQGRKVHVLHFESSPHCQHYRYNREQYVAALTGFLQEVVQSQPKERVLAASAAWADRTDSAMLEHALSKDAEKKIASKDNGLNPTPSISSIDELTSCSSSETEITSSESDLYWETAKGLRGLAIHDISCTACN